MVSSSTASSVAAACSSKLNWRQKRFRRASAHARLRGCRTAHAAPAACPRPRRRSVRRRAWTTGRDGAEHAAALGEIVDGLLRGTAVRPLSSINHSTGPPSPASRASTPARRSDTVESSSLRAGASPSQNGIVGGAPARRGHAVPATTCVICHDIAQLKDVAGNALDLQILVEVPMNVSSGSRTTR